MAPNNSISIFQKLEKFSGKSNEDFTSWLRRFERCLVIAGKNDDELIKGQLLVLCLCGQALAVAERLEVEMRNIGFNVVLRHIKSLKEGVPWTQTYSL